MAKVSARLFVLFQWILQRYPVTVLDNGIANMRSLTSLTMDANASTELAPGGKHVMLFEPGQVMTPGHRITLQFHFTSDDSLIVETPLKSRLSIN